MQNGSTCLLERKHLYHLNNLVAYLVLEFFSDNRHHQRLQKKRQVVQYNQGIATSCSKFLSSSVVFSLLVAELTSIILELPYLSACKVSSKLYNTHLFIGVLRTC